VTIIAVLEGAQLVVGLVGLVGALAEIRASLDAMAAASAVAGRPRRRLIAGHVLFIEGLRILVHGLIMASAGLGILLPPPPLYMGQMILEVIVFRHFAFLLIALVACLGTWSSWWTRRQMARLPVEHP
jgi:UPF0716 family protein affecting phage T7 exclusion